MKKHITALLCLSLTMSMSAIAGAEAVTEEMSEITAEVIEISSAEELAAINDNLSGNYVLAADIDLAGEAWTPIGAFVSSGEGEESEMPDETAAFTGSFDGNGHTISNLKVGGEDGIAVGLFGCIANASVGNFTLDQAVSEGTIMAADAVGYAYFSQVSDVTLTNGTVTAYSSELSGEGMYGGIVAAGMCSVIENCTAQADVVIPDNTANAGIVGGGLEMTSVIGCTAEGTISAGSDCYGLGGISGCGFAAEEFTDCTAQNVTITAGEGSRWIGGITGYAGGYEAAEYGMPVTVFTNCTASNVTVDADENAEGVGDIVGSGFFSEEVAEAMGAPFDQPTQFTLVDCAAQ